MVIEHHRYNGFISFHFSLWHPGPGLDAYFNNDERHFFEKNTRA